MDRTEEKPLKTRIIMLTIMIAMLFSVSYQFLNKMNWLQLLEKATVFSILAYEIESFAFWIFIFWISYITFRIQSLRRYIGKTYMKSIVILWVVSIVCWLLYQIFIDAYFTSVIASNVSTYTFMSFIPWINYEINYRKIRVRQTAKNQGTVL